jgi:hypothetical protein
LKALFGQVLMSEEVMAEVLSKGHPAREESIKAAICSGWLRGFSLLDEPGWSLSPPIAATSGIRSARHCSNPAAGLGF